MHINQMVIGGVSCHVGGRWHRRAASGCSRLSSHSHEWLKRTAKRGEHEVVVREPVVTSRDSTKMPDAIEEVFDYIACAVQRPAVATFQLAVRARRHGDPGVGGANCLHKGIGIVGLVGNDGLGAQMFDKLVRTRDVVGLSLGLDQSQRPVSRIHRQMQLGTQRASRLSECLRAAFLMLRPNAIVFAR
jgi:hypothetical protein